MQLVFIAPSICSVYVALVPLFLLIIINIRFSLLMFNLLHIANIEDASCTTEENFPVEFSGPEKVAMNKEGTETELPYYNCLPVLGLKGAMKVYMFKIEIQ